MYSIVLPSIGSECLIELVHSNKQRSRVRSDHDIAWNWMCSPVKKQLTSIRLLTKRRRHTEEYTVWVDVENMCSPGQPFLQLLPLSLTQWRNDMVLPLVRISITKWNGIGRKGRWCHADESEVLEIGPRISVCKPFIRSHTLHVPKSTCRESYASRYIQIWHNRKPITVSVLSPRSTAAPLVPGNLSIGIE